MAPRCQCARCRLRAAFALLVRTVRDVPDELAAGRRQGWQDGWSAAVDSILAAVARDALTPCAKAEIGLARTAADPDHEPSSEVQQ